MKPSACSSIIKQYGDGQAECVKRWTTCTGSDGKTVL
jgi:hypothetical protein